MRRDHFLDPFRDHLFFFKQNVTIISSYYHQNEVKISISTSNVCRNYDLGINMKLKFCLGPQKCVEILVLTSKWNRILDLGLRNVSKFRFSHQNKIEFHACDFMKIASKPMIFDGRGVKKSKHQLRGKSVGLPT